MKHSLVVAAMLMFAGIEHCHSQDGCVDPRYRRALDRIRHDSSVVAYLFPDRKGESLDVAVSDSLGCPQDDLDAFGDEFYPWIDSLPDSLNRPGSVLHYGTQCTARRCSDLGALSTTLKRECTVYFSQIDENFLGHSALSVNMLRHYPDYEIDRWLVCWVIFDRAGDIVRFWVTDVQE